MTAVNGKVQGAGLLDRLHLQEKQSDRREERMFAFLAASGYRLLAPDFSSLILSTIGGWE
jgi:hypothetical protein